MFICFELEWAQFFRLSVAALLLWLHLMKFKIGNRMMCFSLFHFIEQHCFCLLLAVVIDVIFFFLLCIFCSHHFCWIQWNIYMNANTAKLLKNDSIIHFSLATFFLIVCVTFGFSLFCFWFAQLHILRWFNIKKKKEEERNKTNKTNKKCILYALRDDDIALLSTSAFYYFILL